ncbi:hypothetical protein Tsubulata_045242 [Turnera subulata]|uniref:Reverse transcriptase zinc-binding domain-containing protein n=1 Tax=Turnera subulata TaxID=218843 RepID=A0A9Q0IZ85_9ROSI|nr:hypothetical protein Tsubulata_045242 [Turnera subulata]
MICPLCSEVVEDITHLLLLCPVIVPLWQRLCRWWGVCWIAPGCMVDWFVQ